MVTIRLRDKNLYPRMKVLAKDWIIRDPANNHLKSKREVASRRKNSASKQIIMELSVLRKYLSYDDSEKKLFIAKNKLWIKRMKRMIWAWLVTILTHQLDLSHRTFCCGLRDCPKFMSEVTRSMIRLYLNKRFIDGLSNSPGPSLWQIFMKVKHKFPWLGWCWRLELS